MKKKLINLLIFVMIGVCGYFAYEKFFGCKEDCSKSCESKDTTAVVTNTVEAKYDSVPTASATTITITPTETSTTTTTTTKK